MPDTVETQSTESSVQAASEAEAEKKQDQILGTEKEEAKPAEEKPGETKEEVKEGEKPKAEGEAKKEEAKPAEADEEEKKLNQILARFEGTPEKDRPKALAKAYREVEKLLGEKSSQVGELEKDSLNFRQFQEDLHADFDGTVERLRQALKKQAGEEDGDEEIVVDRKTVAEIVEKELTKKEADKRWLEDQEKLMNERHKDWGELADKRKALKEAVRLGKFPLNDEIFHLAVRGAASPEKLLEDAKETVKKEEADALAEKMSGQVQTQAGGGTGEKKEPTYQEQKEGEVLTEDERAAGG